MSLSDADHQQANLDEPSQVQQLKQVRGVSDYTI